MADTVTVREVIGEHSSNWNKTAARITMGHPGARSLAELVNITRELLVAVTVKAILAITDTYFYLQYPTIK